MRRLRVAQLLITPVLVWDDGEELTSGPELHAMALPLSAVASFLDGLPAEVQLLADKLEEVA